MDFTKVVSLNLSAGGTVGGDLTISGDLTVDGNSSGNYDEIINGNLDLADNNITNVGDISLDTISADNGTSLSFSNNWTNAGRTVADLGIVTTVDINGGTIDVAAIGGASASTGAFTTLTTTDNLTIDANNKGLILGADQDAMLYSEEGGQIVFATGGTGSVGTNNGYMQLNIGGNNADTTLDIRGGNGSGKSILRMAESTGDENDDHYKFVVDGGSFTIESYSTGSWANMCLFDGSANTQRFFGSVTIDGTVILADDLKFGNNPTSFYMDTSDGNDDKKLQMCGGGGVGTDRGATIIMYGNEIANNEGCLDLKAGWKSDEGDIRFFTGNNDERGRINYAGGLAVKGAFVNSASADPADYQISFGGDAVTTPRWGFRVSGSSNEDLYLDRNLSGTPAIAMAWNKANGNTTIKAATLTLDGENASSLNIGSEESGSKRITLNGAGSNDSAIEFRNSAVSRTDLGCFSGSSTFEIKMYDSGWQSRFSITAGGTFAGSSSANISDRDLKENINPISNGLETINKLQGRTFEWKESTKMDGGIKYGLIAQELEEVLPDLVWDKSGLSKKEDGSYHKSIHMTGVIPVLIEAVKELSAKVTELENK